MFTRLVLLLLVLSIGNMAVGQSQETLIDTSKASFWKSPVVRSSIAPVALMGTGLLTIESSVWPDRHDVFEARRRNYPDFNTRADDFLHAVPVAMVYGLAWTGVPVQNNFANRTVILTKAELLMAAMVLTLKYTTNERRPNGADQLSFPSAHTAQAFVTASFMHRELGPTSGWYSVAGYSMATATGVLRILNNEHWISDVLVGAGVGILATNIAYWTHQYKWGPMNLAVAPFYSNGVAGTSLVYRLPWST